MDLALLGSVITIIIINVILSGDNAVVIAMASRRLRPRERRRAIVLGGAGAIGLRVLFTALAALLLDVPFLQLIGGVLLVWVAYRLLAEDAAAHEVAAATTLFGAIQTIIVADVLMSLDNVLAVGGASHGSLALLLFGLVASMPLILLGSTAIAAMMNRYAWLAAAGAAILAVTAARMVADDHLVHARIDGDRHLALVGALSLLFCAIAVALPLVRSSGAEKIGPPTAG